jgi:hypothetical protein
VTLLHSIVAPKLPDQTIQFNDGIEMAIPAAATAFISGAKAFQLLSPEEQEFALNTNVQYAPRAYEWIRDCKATSDGLGIVSQEKERPLGDLTPWEWEKVHAHPVSANKLSCQAGRSRYDALPSMLESSCISWKVRIGVQFFQMLII